MKAVYSEVADQLLQLEVELRRLDLWETEAPSADALASNEPFCVDTLTLSQWLQFVFLPRMAGLIESGQPLPRQSGIAPIAGEYFATSIGAEALITLLGEIDARLQRG